MFRVFIKIQNRDNVFYYLEIDEHLSKDQIFCIALPMNFKSVSHVTLTYSLQLEGKTKLFEGIQSGNEDKMILSKATEFDSLKKALYYKRKLKEFKMLERFIRP